MLDLASRDTARPPMHYRPRAARTASDSIPESHFVRRASIGGLRRPLYGGSLCLGRDLIPLGRVGTRRSVHLNRVLSLSQRNVSGIVEVKVIPLTALSAQPEMLVGSDFLTRFSYHSYDSSTSQITKFGTACRIEARIDHDVLWDVRHQPPSLL